MSVFTLNFLFGCRNIMNLYGNLSIVKLNARFQWSYLGDVIYVERFNLFNRL